MNKVAVVVSIVLSGSAIALPPLAANAATYTRYIGSDKGDFWVASNWDNGLPDSSGYIARLDSAYATPCAITMTNAPGAAFSYLSVEAGEWTLLLRGTRSFGGDWNNGGIRVSSGAKLTIVGGVITNTCFQASSGGQIVFNNVVTRDCLTHRRQVGNVGDRDAYVFDGGSHDFTTMYMRLYQSASFTAGNHVFGGVYGFDKYGESKQNRLPSFLSISGGRVSLTGVDKIDGPLDVGVTVGGSGWFRNLVSGSGQWMADRAEHVWRTEDRGLIETPGFYLATAYATSTARVEVAGGRFVLTSAYGGNGGSGAGRESSILLDGGVLDCNFASAGTLDATAVSATGSHYLRVGANGGRLRNRNNIVLTVNRSGFADAPGVAPGVLTLEGYGKIYLNQSTAGTFTGKTKIRGLVQSDLSTCAFGSGDIEIADGGCLYTTGNAVNNAVTFSGASYIWTDTASGRMSIPSLTRKDDGILILRSTASRTVYGTEANARYLAVGTAPALRSNGLPVDPVILMSSEPGNSVTEAHLVNWDSANGRFVGAAYTTDILDGAGKVVYQNGKTNITSDLSVGALVLRGQVAGGSKTITVGDGEGPAMVVLNPNSNGSSADVSNWTIQFGESRGVISGGTKISGVDTGCARWNGYISGSGGVDFAFVETGGLMLYRQQSWTGGTRVMSGEILLQPDSGLPSGSVEVHGGELSGGSVRFQGTATHAQDFTISGFGAWYGPANKKGALSIEKDVTLSGAITVTNDAMITALDGYTGTLTGAISGRGDLYLGTAARQGALVLSGGISLAGDLHVDTCVTNSGAIDLDGRFIYLEGTLVFNNTSDIVVDAKVVGSGRIVLAGSGKVDFSDLSVFDGVVDVAGNDDAAVGALFGGVAVTNSAASGGRLAVDGTSPYCYFGDVTGVDGISVSGTLVLPPSAEFPPSTDLVLAGGTVSLLGPTAFATLSGHGSIAGAAVSVSGETIPQMTGEERSMAFESYPSLAYLSSNWHLRKVGKGAEIRRRHGFMLIFQ